MIDVTPRQDPHGQSGDQSHGLSAVPSPSSSDNVLVKSLDIEVKQLQGLLRKQERVINDLEKRVGNTEGANQTSRMAYDWQAASEKVRVALEVEKELNRVHFASKQKELELQSARAHLERIEAQHHHNLNELNELKKEITNDPAGPLEELRGRRANVVVDDLTKEYESSREKILQLKRSLNEKEDEAAAMRSQLSMREQHGAQLQQELRVVREGMMAAVGDLDSFIESSPGLDSPFLGSETSRLHEHSLAPSMSHNASSIPQMSPAGRGTLPISRNARTPSPQPYDGVGGAGLFDGSAHSHAYERRNVPMQPPYDSYSPRVPLQHSQTASLSPGGLGLGMHGGLAGNPVPSVGRLDLSSGSAGRGAGGDIVQPVPYQPLADTDVSPGVLQGSPNHNALHNAPNMMYGSTMPASHISPLQLHSSTLSNMSSQAPTIPTATMPFAGVSPVLSGRDSGRDPLSTATAVSLNHRSHPNVDKYMSTYGGSSIDTGGHSVLEAKDKLPTHAEHSLRVDLQTAKGLIKKLQEELKVSQGKLQIAEMNRQEETLAFENRVQNKDVLLASETETLKRELHNVMNERNRYESKVEKLESQKQEMDHKMKAMADHVDLLKNEMHRWVREQNELVQNNMSQTETELSDVVKERLDRLDDFLDKANTKVEEWKTAQHSTSAEVSAALKAFSARGLVGADIPLSVQVEAEVSREAGLRFREFNIASSFNKINKIMEETSQFLGEEKPRQSVRSPSPPTISKETPTKVRSFSPQETSRSGSIGRSSPPYSPAEQETDMLKESLIRERRRMMTDTRREEYELPEGIVRTQGSWVRGGGGPQPERVVPAEVVGEERLHISPNQGRPSPRNPPIIKMEASTIRDLKVELKIAQRVIDDRMTEYRMLRRKYMELPGDLANMRPVPNLDSLKVNQSVEPEEMRGELLAAQVFINQRDEDIAGLRYEIEKAERIRQATSVALEKEDLMMNSRLSPDRVVTEKTQDLQAEKARLKEMVDRMADQLKREQEKNKQLEFEKGLLENEMAHTSSVTHAIRKHADALDQSTGSPNESIVSASGGTVIRTALVESHDPLPLSRKDLNARRSPGTPRSTMDPSSPRGVLEKRSPGSARSRSPGVSFLPEDEEFSATELARAGVSPKHGDDARARAEEKIEEMKDRAKSETPKRNNIVLWDEFTPGITDDTRGQLEQHLTSFDQGPPYVYTSTVPSVYSTQLPQYDQLAGRTNKDRPGHPTASAADKAVEPEGTVLAEARNLTHVKGKPSEPSPQTRPRSPELPTSQDRPMPTPACEVTGGVADRPTLASVEGTSRPIPNTPDGGAVHATYETISKMTTSVPTPGNQPVEPGARAEPLVDTATKPIPTDFGKAVLEAGAEAPAGINPMDSSSLTVAATPPSRPQVDPPSSSVTSASAPETETHAAPKKLSFDAFFGGSAEPQPSAPPPEPVKDEPATSSSHHFDFEAFLKENGVDPGLDSTKANAPTAAPEAPATNEEANPAPTNPPVKIAKDSSSSSVPPPSPRTPRGSAKREEMVKRAKEMKEKADRQKKEAAQKAEKERLDRLAKLKADREKREVEQAKAKAERAAEAERKKAAAAAALKSRNEKKAAASSPSSPKSTSKSKDKKNGSAASTSTVGTGASIAAQLEACNALMAMGFPRDRCVVALEKNNNNVDQAADWLLSNPVSSPKAAAGAPAANKDLDNLLQSLGVEGGGRSPGRKIRFEGDAGGSTRVTCISQGSRQASPASPPMRSRSFGVKKELLEDYVASVLNESSPLPTSSEGYVMSAFASKHADVARQAAMEENARAGHSSALLHQHDRHGDPESPKQPIAPELVVPRVGTNRRPLTLEETKALNIHDIKKSLFAKLGMR